MPRLPKRPNLDQLRHQARDLLDAAKGGNPDALRRLHAASAELTLTGAQLAIARECGYSSWPALKKAVQEHNTQGSAAASTSQDAASDVPGWPGLTAAGDLEIFQGDDAVRVRLPLPEDPLTPSLPDWMGEYRQLAKQRGIDAFVEEIPDKVVLEVRLGLALSNDETLRELKEARVLVAEAKRAAAARLSRAEAKEELILGWWNRSTAPMHAVGYAGIAFTPTGKAAVLLDNGEWLPMTAAQAENLVRHREEEGLPPIPVIDAPAVLPTRDPLRKRPGPRRHTRIELPPSVVTHPLVLWQNPGGGSLTCERVIAYPNGFEIELRASGLLVKEAEMPWGRSSRGFWHFQGLQLTIAFADGRNRHIEDLTSGDEVEELTVSPFRRDDSDLETLWLWVMPSPADGHVRLVATWTLHGIQQAAVEFELTSSQSGEAAP